MDAIMIRLLNMSISASWLIFAIVILRLVLKRSPKWIRCILWGFVAVRLICPISIESVFSLLPSAEMVPSDIGYAKEPVVHTGVPALNHVVNPYLSESLAPDLGASVNPMQIVLAFGGAIWIAGMTAMLLYAMISYGRIRKRVAVSIRVRENLYLCDSIDTPFVLGILKPRIYLPSALAEREEAEYVVAHEKAHIKRRDHWWKPFGFLLLSVYWFNPAIWVAYVLLCRDIELACDECVIRSLSQQDKKLYSGALLSCSLQGKDTPFPHKLISACPLAFGEVGVKKRVKAVLHYKKPAFWVLVLAVLTCILVAVCFLTNPKEKNLYASDPFGHTYRVEDVVYEAGPFSFTYTPETAPLYQFTSDYGMLVSGDILDEDAGNDWILQNGSFEKIKLNRYNFDAYFMGRADGPTSFLGLTNIRKQEREAWRVTVEGDANGLFYYLISTEKGETYLAVGYEQKESTLIRWLFRLAPTDLLRCEAVSKGIRAYIEPVYYPEGFDWAYESLTEGTVNEKGMLLFTADWDTDELVVTEDYDIRATYTLKKNDAGYFELDVEVRSPGGDVAIYYIEGPVGVYIMRILFEQDMEAAEAVSEEVLTEEEVAVRIEKLLDQVTQVSEKSNVQDYIDAHPEQYQELVNYGEHTLIYCFTEFVKGGQTDLRGQIMAAVCKEILAGYGESLLVEVEAAHGQEWFDMFWEIARSMEKRYPEEELQSLYPGSWILLELTNALGIEEKELVPTEELDWEKILKDHLQNEDLELSYKEFQTLTGSDVFSGSSLFWLEKIS